MAKVTEPAGQSQDSILGLWLSLSQVAQWIATCNVGDAGDTGPVPGSGRSPGEGNDYPLQDSCLEDPMDGGAWWATVHGVAKSRTRLSNLTSLQSYFKILILVILFISWQCQGLKSFREVMIRIFIYYWFSNIRCKCMYKEIYHLKYRGSEKHWK